MKALLLMLTLLLAGHVSSTSAAPVRLDGEIVQGALVFGQAPVGSRVELDGEALMVSEGHFVFGFGRDETQARELTVFLPDGERWQRSLQPAEREFRIERVDGLNQNHVTPPPEVYERIRQDAALTRQARTLRDARTDWLDGWIWPAQGRISGVYGSQRILNGEPRNPHWGLDIAAPTGTLVVAPAGGLVTLAEDDLYYSGGTLFIDHGHGLVSAFLHLDELLVEVGERVEQGQQIARIGATGRATGPHLDWRINIGPVRVDPQLLLEAAAP
ncbi:M23 family metallopeptidase [Wenzhouxiangella marina]|uniref:Peptidase n=1 Tax=Wenzhouxiangella marina TaxID=1579979 RepID=A0A0K0XWN8_9GAMM|nr:M23 family metallopeptidase [Wenzhouxiangella marina]AKS42031.1 peptidase [Wenzhouxiangella marina]MBB6086201.1 murein DD-endopeptidase MepM/ murein hydrolase activator NlpD [Wenzhouxiangella marina]